MTRRQAAHGAGGDGQGRKRRRQRRARRSCRYQLTWPVRNLLPMLNRPVTLIAAFGGTNVNRGRGCTTGFQMAKRPPESGETTDLAAFVSSRGAMARLIRGQRPRTGGRRRRALHRRRWPSGNAGYPQGRRTPKCRARQAARRRKHPAVRYTHGRGFALCGSAASLRSGALHERPRTPAIHLDGRLHRTVGRAGRNDPMR